MICKSTTKAQHEADIITYLQVIAISRSNHILPRPPRTLGISIAILASVCLYTCFPLTQVMFLLLVRDRLQTQFNPVDPGIELAPAAFGGDILGFDSARVLAQALIAVLFLLVAALAWRGKPTAIRWIFIAAVVLLSAGNILLLVNTLINPQTLATGLDSGDAANRSLLTTQLCITVAIPLYVVWYLSRGPARAFFRGRYLQMPDQPNPTATQGTEPGPQ